MGAAIPGQSGRFLSDAELSARDEAAYARGVDAARQLADQELVEFRTDMRGLSDGVLQQIAHIEPTMTAQLGEALPGLAVEIARRLLAGYEPPPEVISRICEETLGEIFPERDNLEMVLSPRDAALLEKLNPEWLGRYPTLRIRTDQFLQPGDCQVRSRFGLTDARLSTKIEALQNSIAQSA